MTVGWARFCAHADTKPRGQTINLSAHPTLFSENKFTLSEDQALSLASQAYFERRYIMQLRFCIAAVALCFAAGLAGAQELTPLRVKVFIGAQNLPIFVGIAKGVFAKHGVKVELTFTPNSDVMRNGLAAGEFDIAHSAVDNAVHMVEAAGQDPVIVMGGDSSMNEFIVQPEIKSIADLRGRVIAVDAPNTAYSP